MPFWNAEGLGHVHTLALPQLGFEVKSSPIKMNPFICHQETLPMTQYCSREMLEIVDWDHVTRSARMSSIWKQLLFKKGSVEFTLVKLHSILSYRAQTILEYISKHLWSWGEGQ